jgi:ribulose-bisphosphate carboxylase large chain
MPGVRRPATPVTESSDGSIVITYRVRADPGSIESRADALLLEQTVELPRSALHDPVAQNLAVGRVTSIQAIEDGHRVVLEQPSATVGDDPAQLLNVLFGNSSLQPDVELEDVALPPVLMRYLGGPRFGLPGIRKASGVARRALTCTALKPMGLPVPALAGLAATFARAGIDVVKDDHGLADQAFAPFEHRVRACQAAIDDVCARTGRRTLYVPNVSGTPDRLRRQVDVARAAGVGAVMLSPMLIGLPAFVALVRERLELPVLAHPAFGGTQRVWPVALLGRLFPAFGADAVIFPSFGGRFSYDRETCGALADALRMPRGGAEPVLPMPAGGVALERVPELLAFYGPDTAQLVGASVLADPARIEARSRELVEAVEQYQEENA